MILIGYYKCSTCKNVEKMLKERNVTYTFREITEDVPKVRELKEWVKESGLEIKRFFNTSGVLYKEMKLKDKLEDMSDKEKFELLASEGKLIKRPILVTDDGKFLAVGGKDSRVYVENLNN